MHYFKVPGHADSLLPSGEWRLVWQDEFDGTELDRSKWDFRREMMGRRHPGWCGEEGIRLDGQSNLIFKLIRQDDNVCSCTLQTGYNFMDAVRDEKNTRYSGSLNWPIPPFRKNLYLHKYGYYECRCRLQRKEGWWSAFWIQSPTIGASADACRTGVEIDIMESFHPGELLEHCCHWGGYGSDHQMVRASETRPFDQKEYHLFGVLWTEKGYTFYVDGKEDGHVDGPISDCPEFLLIGTEVNGYRNSMKPTEEAIAAVGDTFIVDHIRVFDKIS